MEKEYQGTNGIMTLTDSAVKIAHKGFMGFLTGEGALRGDKTIPYSRIVAVRMKNSGLTKGYIQLTLMGGTEDKRGVYQALKDENALMFSGKRGNETFAEAKKLIEERIGGDGHRSSDIDELEKLSALKDKGIITQPEFDQKKKQILGL